MFNKLPLTCHERMRFMKEEVKTSVGSYNRNYYDVKALASEFDVSIDFIRSLILRVKNNLPATIVGRKYVLQKTDIDKFLNREKWVK